MFTKINILNVDLDRAFSAGIGYSLSYYFFFSFVQGFPLTIGTALMRGLEFFVAQCLSEIVIRNVSHSSASFLRKIKDQLSVDILAALLMSGYTSYSVTGSFFSLGMYPTTIGLSAVADLVGCYLAKAFNMPYVVGEAESIRYANAQRAKELEAIGQPVFASPEDYEDSLPNRGVGELKISYA